MYVMMFVTPSLDFLPLMTWLSVISIDSFIEYRSECRDDPLVFVINTIKCSNTMTGKLIADYIRNHVI